MYHNSVKENTVFSVNKFTNEVCESTELEMLLDQIFLTDLPSDEQWVTNLNEKWWLN
jgi:hypothetical protein